MRTDFDFAPLFHSAVGFDRMLEMLRSAAQAEPIDNDPPYDIERRGEDAYRVTLAVAGFDPEELSVTAQQNLLTVSGEKRSAMGCGSGWKDEGLRHFLHHGIATRAFERRFELADHVKVVGANLGNGLLTIELRREMPEAMQPRRIEIGTGGGQALASRRIGAQAAEERRAA